MILDTTHTDKKQTELINDMVGKPFGFFQALKMKGIGSKRMIVEDVSPNMKSYLNTVADINYANLELRPIGILIRINKGLKLILGQFLIIIWLFLNRMVAVFMPKVDSFILEITMP